MVPDRDVPPRSLAPTVLRSLLAGCAALLLLATTACSSGDEYTASTGQLAERFIPSGQTVPYHPDSLGTLTVKEKEKKLKLEIEGTYRGMMEQWSTRPRDVSANPSRSTRDLTYATFWSRELSLASLEAETALSSLSKERAQSILDRRDDEYQDFVQIDVYWFGPPEENLVAGPATIVRLRAVRDGQRRDSTYSPARRSYQPVREAFVGAGRTELYRRNTFYFDRKKNGHDILAGTDRVILEVRPTGSTRDLRFRWSWGAEPTGATADSGRQGRQ